jgi:hypothetical protein
MSAWQRLVSIAVVGTERRAVPPAITSDVAAIVDGDVASGRPEEQVLVAAGVLGAWRRAGAVTPPDGGPPPDPAPDDRRPLPSARAVQLLQLLLDGHVAARDISIDLAADWLARCGRSGRRLPARLLPPVMDAATTATALRVPAIAAGGPRLHWLAERNPAWAWAQGIADPSADPERVWAEGRREQRLAALGAMRASDPERARALLAGTWKGEPAGDRARFVAVLETGLSPADEPLLEAALDDRSKAVRAAAAALLAALPNSALARRMIERVRPLVRRERGRLAVELPADVDAAAARDGIGVSGAPPRTGQRVWTLIQIVAATPLDFWERELATGPDKIIRLGSESAVLLTGWAQAATRQRNRAWTHHLLPRIDDAAVTTLLADAPAPWPPDTSRAIVLRLRSVADRRALLPALTVLPAKLDPAATDDVERWTASLPPDDLIGSRLRALTQVLSVRRAIAEELV